MSLRGYGCTGAGKTKDNDYRGMEREMADQQSRNELTIVAQRAEMDTIRQFAVENDIGIEELDHEGFGDPLTVMALL